MSDDSVLATGQITKPHRFGLRPDAEARTALAERLGITAIKKLTFTGEIGPVGAKDLKLAAKIGATVVQPCVVTNEPVTTRIDEDVLRLYAHDFEAPEGDEAEMPEDDTIEPLPTEIDLGQVMEEALALALPPWPRADGVDPVDITVTEPDATPMSDEDVKPFAGLKDLRDAMSKGGKTE